VRLKANACARFDSIAVDTVIERVRGFQGVLIVNLSSGRLMRDQGPGEVPSPGNRTERAAPRLGERLCLDRVGLVFGALIVCGVLLRLINPDVVRFDLDERSALYQYDPEIGWLGQPNTTKPFTPNSQRTATHNSRGLRDAEIGEDDRPTILFLGDSFVWGYGVEVDDRFTNVLRNQLTNYRIVNAGVSGFGTDQEYLLMKRLWDRIHPAFVFLVVCTHNDHTDNSSNLVYAGYYKPYFRRSSLSFDGQPVPVSARYVFQRYSIARHSFLARLFVQAVIPLGHPSERVPDPTDTLVLMIRHFAQEHGAGFAMGLTGRDPELEPFLQAQRIPFVSFDGVEHFPGSPNEHWTPAGNVQVAKRVADLLGQVGIAAK